MRPQREVPVCLVLPPLWMQLVGEAACEGHRTLLLLVVLVLVSQLLLVLVLVLVLATRGWQGRMGWQGRN